MYFNNLSRSNICHEEKLDYKRVIDYITCKLRASGLKLKLLKHDVTKICTKNRTFSILKPYDLTLIIK